MKNLMVVLVAIVALALGACSKDGPEVKHAKELAAKLDDVRQARDIVDSAVARKVICAVAVRHAFSKETGEAQVWTYRRDDNILECYDTAGFHPTKRTPLLKITSDEVSEIMGNPDCYPLPRPAPKPTPLPDLSEGPCCGRP